MRRSPADTFGPRVSVRETPTLWGSAPSLTSLRPTLADAAFYLRRRATVHFSLLAISTAMVAAAAFTSRGPAAVSAIPSTGATDSLVLSAKASIVARAIPLTSQSSGESSYQVAAGDTLTKIARQVGVSEEALLAYNGLSTSDSLNVGMRLNVPDLATVPPEQLRIQDTAPHEAVPPLPDQPLPPQKPTPEIRVHTVVSGDSIYGIAQDAGISAATLMASNNLRESSNLALGQQIVLPALNGRLVATKPGDTLATLSATYAGTPEAILIANKLPPRTDVVAADQLLLVPTDSVDILKVVVPSAAPTAGTSTPTGVATAQALAAPLPKPAPQPRPASAPDFGWPAPGVITTYFSSWHNGIDVANSAGTPVRAAQAGVVAFSGWDNSGFGYMIRIDHGNGLQTLYGHASRLLVNVGQSVDKGDVVMLMGSTGRSTGPHVHFSVFQGSGYSALNPLRYLP
jgi:murein DD-endopeptidase MepM/ murein hydrolase activator NlpD